MQGDFKIAHCGGFHSFLNLFIKAVNLVAKLLHHNIRWDTETIGCDPRCAPCRLLSWAQKSTHHQYSCSLCFRCCGWYGGAQALSWRHSRLLPAVSALYANTFIWRRLHRACCWPLAEPAQDFGGGAWCCLPAADLASLLRLRSLSSIPTGEQRALQLAMQEVADWMALPGNEEEFVVLFFDDQMDINDWVRSPARNAWLKSPADGVQHASPAVFSKSHMCHHLSRTLSDIHIAIQCTWCNGDK